MIYLIRDNVEIIVASEEMAVAKEGQGFKRINLPVADCAADEPKEDLSKMTKSELIALAYERGINCDPRAKKQDILAALSK